MNPDYDYLFKIRLIGSRGVGKTHLMTRFINDQNSQNNPALPSLVIDNAKESEDASHSIMVDFNGKTIKLVIFHQHRHLLKKITDGFSPYSPFDHDGLPKQCHATVIVFDVSDQNSFDDCRSWDRVAQMNEGKVWLVGNKIDVANRVVAQNQAQLLAQQFNAPYVETSAQTGQNVQQLYNSILQTLLNKYNQSNNSNVNNNNNNNQTRNECHLL
mmetsp:Transcript_7836/g.13652  ORF Transcript_7836/g.13652 Transcript_7836/m.13652 type:complete len:214 (+) Transcript_7836:2-643(+)